jgi:hypothetical protein
MSRSANMALYRSQSLARHVGRPRADFPGRALRLGRAVVAEEHGAEDADVARLHRRRRVDLRIFQRGAATMRGDARI